MAKDNRREERRARKKKKKEEKNIINKANEMAKSITNTNAPKQKVDKKTGLTIADEPTRDSGGIMGGNFGEGDITTSTVKQVARDKNGNVIEGKEAIKKAILYGEATQSQQETLTKSGKPLSPKQKEKRKERQEAKTPVVEKKEDLGDLDPDFKDQSSPIPDSSDKGSSDKVSSRKARRQNKRYYKNLEKSEEQQRNQEASNITEKLKEEARATSPNADVLLEKLEVASELERQVKQEEKEQRKAKKKIERIDRKTGGILGVLSSVVPPEIKDGLTNLKPKDLVELASKFGIKDTEGDREIGKNSMASGYIDTIEKLGVQDYFPNAGQSIAVGTFSGARIGSETIYAGGGANLPLGLYDARKRALKAKFGATQKTISQLADFTKVPPQYRRDVQEGLSARYNEIQSDNSLSMQEKANQLEDLSAIVDEVTYAYNSAKDMYGELLKNGQDNIYIGRKQKDDIEEILGNFYSPEKLEKYMSGDNKYNIAKDAVEKLKFHKNLLSDVEDVATQMKSFEKSSLNGYLSGLSEDELKDMDDLVKSDDLSNFQQSVYFKAMKKYYSEDVDKLFADNFLDENENLRPEYSEEQRKKGLSYLKDMLAPSYDKEIIQIATGNAAKGRLAIDKELNKFVFQEQFKEETEAFPRIMSGADPSEGLKAYGAPVISNIGGKKVYSVERNVKFSDFYQDKSNYLRPNGAGINKIRIRVTRKSSNETYLMTPDLLMASGLENWKATDGGADIKQQDLDYLNGSTKVLMTKNIVTPAYMNSNNAVVGVQSDLSNQGDYTSSSNKVSMYEDIGRPMYMESYLDEVDGKQKQREIGLPFSIQGPPVMNTSVNAQKNDNAYTKQQSFEKRSE